jgi:hypothetical protein
VYKLDSFVGFIGDEQLHAQECYGSIFRSSKISSRNFGLLLGVVDFPSVKSAIPLRILWSVHRLLYLVQDTLFTEIFC